jgi:ATP-binding protein involved in chromosome partitioning
VTTPQDVAMIVAIKAIGMFNKLNVPIVGVVENMSYLQCPHCNEQVYLFGKEGGKRISEDFKIPFIGEIPLHPGIRESSDVGKPSVVSEPDSVQAHAFTKAAKVIAGRISILAAEIKAQGQAQNQVTEQTKED